MAMMPPREVPTTPTLCSPRSGQEIERVEQLDEGRVVPPMAIVLRPSAPAIIEAIDVARLFRMLGEIGRKRVEIPGVPGEPRQADDGPELLVRRRVVADIEPKVVERRIVDISPQLAIKLGHVQGSTLGACLDGRALPRASSSVFSKVAERASLTSDEGTRRQVSLRFRLHCDRPPQRGESSGRD